MRGEALSVVLLLLLPAAGVAQDLGGHEAFSDPEDMAHPDTGEAGTWIPRWVERVHVLDHHRLQMCLKDVAFADKQMLALADESTSLRSAFEDLEHVRDGLLVEVYGGEEDKKNADRRLVRRLRAVWGLVGVSAALSVGAAVAIWH